MFKDNVVVIEFLVGKAENKVYCGQTFYVLLHENKKTVSNYVTTEVYDFGRKPDHCHASKYIVKISRNDIADGGYVRALPRNPFVLTKQIISLFHDTRKVRLEFNNRLDCNCCSWNNTVMKPIFGLKTIKPLGNMPWISCSSKAKTKGALLIDVNI